MAEIKNLAGTKLKIITPEELGLMATYSLKYVLSTGQPMGVEAKGIRAMVTKLLPLLRSGPILTMAAVMQEYLDSFPKGDYPEVWGVFTDLLNIELQRKADKI